jgi:hypothetical protein
MGFGKSIKDALWTSGDTPKVVPVPTPATAAAPVPTTPTPACPAAVSAAPVATVYSPINEDMVKDITEAVDSANLPGYDYLELKAAVNVSVLLFPCIGPGILKDIQSLTRWSMTWKISW